MTLCNPFAAFGTDHKQSYGEAMALSGPAALSQQALVELRLMVKTIKIREKERKINAPPPKSVA